MTDELKPWTEDHLKSALVNLIEASKNSVRGPERSGSEQAASGIFKQIVAAWNARAPSVPAGWQPLSTLEHRHAYDAPLVMDGKNMPATYVSDSVILTDGKRVWVERSVIMGGALSSSADKFTAYPSGDKPTHWMPLPAAPKVPA